jgi:hypothetical protein
MEAGFGAAAVIGPNVTTSFAWQTCVVIRRNTGAHRLTDSRAASTNISYASWGVAGSNIGM